MSADLICCCRESKLLCCAATAVSPQQPLRRAAPNSPRHGLGCCLFWPSSMLWCWSDASLGLWDGTPSMTSAMVTSCALARRCQCFCTPRLVSLPSHCTGSDQCCLLLQISASDGARMWERCHYLTCAHCLLQESCGRY